MYEFSDLPLMVMLHHSRILVYQSRGNYLNYSCDAVKIV